VASRDEISTYGAGWFPLGATELETPYHPVIKIRHITGDGHARIALARFARVVSGETGSAIAALKITARQ
jgi:hypothetical protein